MVFLSPFLNDVDVDQLCAHRYILVKKAMLSFLSPENLKNYVRRMDDLVTISLQKETNGKDTIKVVDFMKKLTFDVACNILFGIHDVETREAFLDDFHLVFEAFAAFPVEFPGSSYSKGLQAKARISNRFLPILRRRKEELSTGALSPTNDVVSCLLALRDENGEPIPEEVVVDNFRFLIIASHDTTAVLLSLMVWKLSRDEQIFSEVLNGMVLPAFYICAYCSIREFIFLQLILIFTIHLYSLRTHGYIKKQSSRRKANMG